MSKFNGFLEKFILISAFFLLSFFKDISMFDYVSVMKEYLIITGIFLTIFLFFSFKNELLVDRVKEIKKEIQAKEKDEKQDEEKDERTTTFSFSISSTWLIIVIFGFLYGFNFITLSNLANSLIVIEVILFILTMLYQINFSKKSEDFIKKHLEGGE